ncbi:MAG: hypothetical protein ABI180_03400 [Microcoleus sp.]
MTQSNLDLKFELCDRELALAIVSIWVRSTLFYLKSPFKTRIKI